MSTKYRDAGANADSDIDARDATIKDLTAKLAAATKPPAPVTLIHPADGNSLILGGHKFEINAARQVVIDGVADTKTGDVSSGEGVNGVFRQTATLASGAIKGQWDYTPTGWIDAAGPTPAPTGSLSAGLMMGLGIERSEYAKLTKADLVSLKKQGVDHVRVTHGRDGASWPATLDMSKFPVWGLMDNAAAAGLTINLDFLFESGLNCGYPLTDAALMALSASWVVQAAMEGQKRYGDQHVTSLINEPYDSNWNLVRDILQQRIDALRKAGYKGRIIVSDWGISNMTGFVTDPLGGRLLLDGHCYPPGSFTRGHGEAGGPLPADFQAQFAAELDSRLVYANKYKMPFYAGEYGCASGTASGQAYTIADRAKYMAGVTAELNRRNLARAYWETTKGFGIVKSLGPLVIEPAYQAALGLKAA